MTEVDRIKKRLRDARDLMELRAVWESEIDDIQKLVDLMKARVVNLKEYRKQQFTKGANE